MSGFSFQETKLTVSRSARMVSSAPLTDPVQTVWIVLHGYAQLAADFLSEFEPVARPGVLFVAPEGLSRFYRRPRNTHIGASWMTAEARDDEITDYLAYLNKVYDLIVEKQRRRPKFVGVLGFSQGCSTASRWVESIHNTRVEPIDSVSRTIDRMVLWGGTPAVELRSSSYQNDIAPCRVDWVTGTTDRFTPPEKLTELHPEMDTVNNPIQMTIFEGKHEIDANVLNQILYKKLN